MYQIYCDGQLIYDPRIASLAVASADLDLQINKTGTFTFELYPDHPYYALPKILESAVTLEKDGDVLFSGRIIVDDTGFYNQRLLTCEGELAYLVDSRVRPAGFSGTPAEVFAALIAQHNAQVEPSHQFKVGTVTATNSDGYVVFSDDEYNTTWDVLNNGLMALCAGYLRLRHESDGVYIDYLDELTDIAQQRITCGQNLLDYSRRIKGEEIITALIPLGAEQEDGSGRLTIASVNGGDDYIYDQDAVDEYGWIFGVRTWDDMATATNLLAAGQAELNARLLFPAEINISAADLSLANGNYDDFRLGQYVFVDSPTHGMEDAKYQILKLQFSLLDPSSNTITLNRTYYTASADIAEQNKTTSDLVQIIERVESNYTTNETVASAVSELYSAINQTADEILMEVGSTYVTSDGLQQELETRFTQTQEGFEFQFNQLQQMIDEVGEGSDAQFDELKAYIRFIDGDIVLGQQSSSLQCVISNDRISFLQSGVEVAYISNNKLYITQAQITDSLQLGSFAFVPRENGNLSLVWKG